MSSKIRVYMKVPKSLALALKWPTRPCAIQSASVVSNSSGAPLILSNPKGLESLTRIAYLREPTYGAYSTKLAPHVEFERRKFGHGA